MEKESKANPAAENETQTVSDKVPYRTAFYYLIAFLILALAFFCGVSFINHKKAEAELRFSELDIMVSNPPSAASPPATANANGKINVNTADAALLATLPRIGETRAQKIIAHREYYGLFTDASDLLKVDGIGEKTLAEITPYITFSDIP